MVPSLNAPHRAVHSPAVKLLEYQAKRHFAAACIDVPAGRLARTPDEAAEAASELGRIAVKAQVPVGGRGKAGGIAVVGSPEEARREAERILAMDIHGYPVRSVWCETGLDIAHEMYLGVTLDRDRRRLALMLSAAGGMEIERVAAEFSGEDRQALARSCRRSACLPGAPARLLGARPGS